LKKRVLVACGTSIATATVVAEKIKEIAKKNGIDVEVSQCKAAEVPSKVSVSKPDLIVATTPVYSKVDVPVLNGIPFLSGVGMETLTQQIVDALKK
jgi:PTS system galactitol-specific IIB component